ncbi:HAD domain-containing protein [Actinoplanes sp. NPDC026623]|uniref:HAD domain-containing protein n=1 Tax=Actinoplanes sp. NPDC026623 TaxID=3155610 RepID=UPI0033F597D4
MINVERPVWLLDVDGVLNTVRPGWGGPPRRSLVWSSADNTSYPMRWAPALIDRIRALQAAGKVEIRWCTTWCPEAERLERLWSLPELARSLDADPMPRGSDCWPLKQRAALAVLAEGRRLIWTDDEALPPPGPQRDELSAHGRALLIAPRSARGLQPADLDLIGKFAEGRRLPTHRVAGRHRHAVD